MLTRLEYPRPEKQARASTGSHSIDVKLGSLDGHACMAAVHHYLAAILLPIGLAASRHCGPTEKQMGERRPAVMLSKTCS
jgi:hypothetical protein